MTVASEQLRTELLSLCEDDRAELAEILIDSLPCGPYIEDDPAFMEELVRREANIRNSVVIGVPAEEVFAKLDERLSQHGQ